MFERGSALEPDEELARLQRENEIVAGGLIMDSVAGVVHSEWGFKDEDTLQLTHGVHPYPARMVPQVARKLLAAYSKEDTLVWDP